MKKLRLDFDSRDWIFEITLGWLERVYKTPYKLIKEFIKFSSIGVYKTVDQLPPSI